jgi:hypothetical protein
MHSQELWGVCQFASIELCSLARSRDEADGYYPCVAKIQFHFSVEDTRSAFMTSMNAQNRIKSGITSHTQDGPLAIHLSNGISYIALPKRRNVRRRHEMDSEIAANSKHNSNRCPHSCETLQPHTNDDQRPHSNCEICIFTFGSLMSSEEMYQLGIRPLHSHVNPKPVERNNRR